jgi:hypothetical protein
MTYAEKLNRAKESYPFARWRESEIEMYTPENCAAMQAIFDDLIAALIEKGETTSESEKIELFRLAIERTNELDGETGMVETGEREDLCELTNVISEAAGLNPDNYGGGEGLASEWRDW